jgi:hypothetical protein
MAYLGLDIATDYFSVVPAAKIGSNLASGLQKLAGSYGSSIASGGGSVIKTGVGGSVDNIVFRVSLSDEVVVITSKVGGQGLAAKTSTKLLPMLPQTTRQSVLSSAQVFDKNGLSVAGRALKKHAGRPGPFNNIKFSHKTGN